MLIHPRLQVVVRLFAVLGLRYLVGHFEVGLIVSGIHLDAGLESGLDDVIGLPVD
jgi:hypothetical protein